MGLLLVVASIVGSQVVGVIARTALYEYAIDERRVGPFAQLGPTDVHSED